MSPDVRVALAGDRRLASDVLRHLLAQGTPPVALLLPASGSHGDELRALAALPDDRVLVGRDFRTPAGMHLLSSLDLDYLLSVHFPYLIPPDVLRIPAAGCLNLHPALLPFNRGWHTPSWAILEGTPAGATLHFMDDGIDTGDIVCQQAVEVRPDDTADSLYQRLLDAELTVFQEAWPALAARSFRRRPQRSDHGTTHDKADLSSVQHLDLDAVQPVGEVLRSLRGLTTNSVSEAAYFEVDGARYHVQVTITEAARGAQ